MGQWMWTVSAWFVCFVLAFSGTVTAKDAEWTFLLYLASDNNLEASQLQDLREMIAIGGSEEVQFIALVDRSVKDDSSQGYSKDGVGELADWTTAKYVRVDRNRLTELGDWDEVNMGDRATLKRFLETSMKQFPAKKYALIFGDHGAGWPGVCGDESHNDDMLTMTEIHDTLKTLPKGTSKFELIGFDACLMGNLECAFSVAPFAKVMVASEELEPGCGWNYTPLFQRIVENPAISGADVGKAIVETYDDFFKKSDNPHVRKAGVGTTLSAVDLTKLPQLIASLQSLSKACQTELDENGRDSWIWLADARAKSEEFGMQNRSGHKMGLIDLGHLAGLIRDRFIEGPINESAQELQKSLKSFVISNRHGKGRVHAHGVSIFFPADHDQLAANDTDDGTKGQEVRNAEEVDAYLNAYSRTLFAKNHPWLAFVTDFAAVAATDTEDPTLGEVTASTTEITPGEAATFTAEIEADDVETSSFVLARLIAGNRVIIGELPATQTDDGKLTDEWDGRWFALTVGDKQIICPVTDLELEEADEDDDNDDAKDEADDGPGKNYFIEVPVELQRKGKELWVPVSLYFYVDITEDDVTGEFVYAFKETKNGPTEVELEEGDRLRPVFKILDEDGGETRVVSDDEKVILTLDDPEDLSVGMIDVPAAKYEVGFQVYDFSENYSEQYIEVEVAPAP